MSHNITVSDIKITDLDALESAVNELKAEGANISMSRNAKYRGYNTSQSRDTMPVVINLPDAPWDLGFDKDAEGNYVPVFDPYKGHIRNAVGFQPNEVDGTACDINSPAVHIGKLIQRYAACKIEREAAVQGRSVQRAGVDEHNNIRLVVGGY